MNMQEVRAIAKARKIDSTGMSKVDIIHTLQREEGNFDCFASARDGLCDQLDCQWREDCLSVSVK